MPSSSDRKRLEVPTHLYDRLVEIAIDEDRTVASVTQEVIAAGLQYYVPAISPDRDLTRYTQRARAALDRAREEAVAFNHSFIGTEHLLLALLRVEDGVSARVLGKLGLDYEKCRQYCHVHIKRGDGSTPTPAELPYLPRARRTLRLAVEEADRLGHRYVGTEHLLLALAGVRDGMAARILSYFDILSATTGETLRAITASAA